MSDLISRKVVIEVIESLCSDGNMYGNENLTLINAYAAIDKITEIEVAYDVDKVMEELKEAINDLECNLIGDCENDILNIVKRGGQG